MFYWDFPHSFSVFFSLNFINSKWLLLFKNDYQKLFMISSVGSKLKAPPPVWTSMVMININRSYLLGFFFKLCMCAHIIYVILSHPFFNLSFWLVDNVFWEFSLCLSPVYPLFKYRVYVSKNRPPNQTEVAIPEVKFKPCVLLYRRDSTTTLFSQRLTNSWSVTTR